MFDTAKTVYHAMLEEGGDGCDYVNHGRSAVDCEVCKGSGFAK